MSSDGKTRIELPDGTVVTITEEGKVEFYGTVTDEVLELIRALDPDAEVACPLPAAPSQDPAREPPSSEG